MARHVQRTNYEPRMEMAPLLDVIFLLLTFFIYSLVLTVRAEVLPVQLPTISSAEIPAKQQVAGITVDGDGNFYLNQNQLSRAELEKRLKQIAGQDDPPTVFLALEARSGRVDRGPIFINLIDTLRRLGIQDFHIVGRKKQPGGTGSGAGTGSNAPTDN